MVSQSASNTTLGSPPLIPFEDAVSKSNNSKLNPDLLQRQLDSNFKIFHQNTRGLSFKIEEFLLYLSKINPQVICLNPYLK